MSRRAVLLLCALVAAAVGAAPAPQPRQTGPWLDGWDKPVDPLGDCRFDRRGDKLTITVPPASPGKDHGLHVARGALNAPRLLRDVEGDFTVQVRVGGRLVAAHREQSIVSPGLLLTDGKTYISFSRGKTSFSLGGEVHDFWLGWSVSTREQSGDISRANRGVPPEQVAFLRMERRGDTFLFKFSHDGQRWEAVGNPVRRKLPRSLKLGVVAVAWGEETFKPWFDQLKLTPPGGKTR